MQGNKVIVFMATQDMVDLHAALLTPGLEVFADGRELELSKLHGNMAQQERTRVFHQFRKATAAVLLCTVSLTLIPRDTRPKKRKKMDLPCLFVPLEINLL